MNSETRPRAKDSPQRVFLGRVGVDSGVLVLADPAYIRRELLNGQPVEEFYRRAVGSVDSKKLSGSISSRKLPSSIGVACRIQSDGTYDVWGELRHDGTGLQQIVIDLTTD